MITIETKLKRWGSSYGIIVPMNKIKQAHLSEKDKLNITITKETNPLKKTFGMFKFKRTTEEILREGDRESWDE